jgi:hypothetical protein
VYLLKALRQLDQTGPLNRAKLLMGMAVLMMCAALSSFAQSDNIEMQIPMTTSVTGAVRMKIPFAFTVADKTFQAGEYYVGAANEKAIAIRSVNGKQAAVALTNSVIDSHGTSLPRIVFHKYGDRYFLTQAWLRASNQGREFYVSSEEAKSARAASAIEVALVPHK